MHTKPITDTVHTYEDIDNTVGLSNLRVLSPIHSIVMTFCNQSRPLVLMDKGDRKSQLNLPTGYKD